MKNEEQPKISTKSKRPASKGSIKKSKGPRIETPPTQTPPNDAVRFKI